MKFKKQDLGLYFAASLVGAGSGLLVGALIASRLTEPDFVPFLNEEDQWHEPITPPQKNAGEKKPRKTSTKLKAQDDPELAKFIAEWEPNTIQIEALKTNLVTMEDLQELLITQRAAEEAEPYNYSTIYQDDKPELIDLVKLPEEEEPIDDRYQILRDPPPNKDIKSQRVIHWDPEDDTFYTLTRKKQPVPTTLRGMISDETWVALVPYFDKGYNVLYVDDLETIRFYKFVVVPDDMEDSSENGRDPQS